MDLVTGGTGIVGMHVLNELLAQGRPVRALVRPGSDTGIVRRVLRHYHPDGDERFARIAWVEGDLLEPDGLLAAMANVERVFHCAALVSFDPREKEALFLHNITGTAAVVDAMLAAGVPRLCHVSSTATIGRRADGSPNNEEVPFKRDRSSSAYAISKYEAELEVQRGIAEGLHAVMVNPCVVIGPGAHGRSSMTMIDRVRKGTRYHPSGSNAVVDARDVAAAMVRLLDLAPNGGRYLLIGENLSYRRLFALIAEEAGRPAPSLRLRPWMLELAWRVERLRTLFGGRPLITVHTARTASRPRAYDGSKVHALLDLPMRDARTAVRNVMAYLRGTVSAG